jgi:hypothetical protein
LAFVEMLSQVRSVGIVEGERIASLDFDQAEGGFLALVIVAPGLEFPELLDLVVGPASRLAKTG